jgi:calcineurin-like phosphoesterase family protein
MKNTWFIADTHFSHTNIIRYSKRPFASVEEHDETLVENWNRHVQPGDDVFFLGDLMLSRRKEHAQAFRTRLAGNIHFIEGNHDDAAHQIRASFVWYREVMMITVNGRKIWLSHYAHRVWNKSHHGAWHLYGHSHHSLVDDRTSLSFDAGVDSTAVRLGRPDVYGTGVLPDEGLRPQDYRPIHFDEVAAVMAEKTFVPVDHHGADRES